MSSLLKHLGKLIGPTLRWVLVKNQTLFLWTYDLISNRPTYGGSWKLRKEVNIQPGMRSCLEEMRQHGISIIRGHFDNLFIETIKSILSEGLEISDRAFIDGSPDTCEIEDLENGVAYFKNDSRLRIQWKDSQTAPAPIRDLMTMPIFHQMAKCYYGAPSRCLYVTGERLVPSKIIEDRWHFDRVTDQFKVMVLVSTVNRSNGPMRYKIGTHLRPDILNSHFFQVFKGGVSFAYPSNAAVDSLGIESKYVLGEPGDCVLFDTLGVHAPSGCHEGSRTVLIIAYEIDTFKNRFLRAVARGKWV